jgi:hypothetical protein
MGGAFCFGDLRPVRFLRGGLHPSIFRKRQRKDLFVQE